MSLRAAAAGLLGALVLLVLPAPAALAHDGGLEAEPHQPRILAVEPAVPGLTVSVVEGGARLALANDTPVPVDVVPAGSARGEEPVVEPGGRAHWADARVGSDAGAWTVLLSVGGLPVAVRGETVLPPAPATAGWWALTAALAVGTAAVGILAVRRRPSAVATAGLTVLAVGAHLVHVLGSALVPVHLPYWPTVAGTAGIAVGAWVLGLAGAGLAAFGGRWGLLLCALAGAVLALVTALDTGSFAHAVLPYAWDPTLDRVSTAVTVGVGFGLFLTGFSVLRAMTPAHGVEPA